jgi:hypothetical protein
MIAANDTGGVRRAQASRALIGDSAAKVSIVFAGVKARRINVLTIQ